MKKEITPLELKKRLDTGESLRIVDVRMPIEFVIGHIPGAVNVPLPKIVDQIPEVNADETLIMVCKAGGRSSMACEKVESHYPNLINLEGGTDAWIASGLKISRGTK